MDGQTNTSQLSQVFGDDGDDGDVLTTVVDFGDAQIKRSTKANLALLTVSGSYDQKLGKAIERLAIQARGNLGLEFRDMKVHPTTKKKFDPSIVPLLSSIRSRYEKRGRTFVLCSPPSELADVLTLAGVLHTFQVAAEPGTAVAQAPPREKARPVEPPPGDAADAKHAIGKKIFHLNQSLKRTASLEKGLDSAEKCVKRFLPQAPPEVDGYSFSFSCESSEKVGGDLFDFIPLGDEHLGICIGDVSGHGIDAALLMGISKKVIHIRALDAGPDAGPKAVLRQANVDLVTDFTRSTFVTVLYGVLHLPTGAFTYARAGHEPPYVCGPQRSSVIPFESNGIPLGIDSGRLFDRVLEERTILVRPGSFIFLCTDGLAECWNPRGTQYSKERLKFALGQFDHTTPCREALESVLKSIRDFAEGRPEEDDMTAILFQRRGEGS